MTLPLHRLIEERALELGFCGVGIIPARPLEHAAHLDRWLADGFHGEMKWMERHRDLRTHPGRLEPGTRSVIALAAPYAADRHNAPPGHISRYALGDDYHDVLRQRMRSLAAFVSAETGHDVAARPAVDSAPLLERNIAIDAGLGWLGKSAMVLHQQHGTWFFLAELLVDVDLVPLDEPQPDRCGRCTRCIDACPTGAIVAPWRVDARRCISYLTIELRGPIPRPLRKPMGTHLFGCDICQEVCPWNHHATRHDPLDFRARPETIAADARTFLQLSPTAFNARFRGSPIHRAKRRGMARNAAVVLGNLGDPDHAPILLDTLREHDEPLARGHAAWALGQLAPPRLEDHLARALRREENAWVHEEIRHTLEQHPGP